MAAVLMSMALLLCAVFLSSTALYCPDGYTLHGSFCYKFNFNKLSWKEARYECVKTPGASLVAIDDTAEDLALTELCIKHKNDAITFWTSARDDLPIVSGWVWEKSYDPITHFNWHPSQPSHRGTEHCIIKFLGPPWVQADTSYQWGDLSCNSLQASICEW